MTLKEVYALLHRAYGPQGWWPAETPFEVMVGAVLTQNAAWTHVERAIAALKAKGCLTPACLCTLPEEALWTLIRPAGFFRVKARRLKALCAWYVGEGGYEALRRLPTDKLRHGLLAIHGIGPETADDILLYAFQRPVFVIDAYTRRLFARLGLIRGDEGYEVLRRRFEAALPGDVKGYQEYHALIVRHAKEVCRKRPLCPRCCLRPLCPHAA